MKQTTLDWLRAQSLDENVPSEVREELVLLVEGQAKGTPTPLVSNYLVARPNPVPISATNGTWDREKQEKKFTSRVDGDFESCPAVSELDKATDATNGVVHDLVKDGTYEQIFPDTPKDFFQNATQALQAVHDNPALVDELIQQDKRLHIPFKNSKGEKFVAGVFMANGELEVILYEFLSTNVWKVSSGEIFVLPEYSGK